MTSAMKQLKILQITGLLLATWGVIIILNAAIQMATTCTPPFGCSFCAPELATPAFLLMGIELELWLLIPIGMFGAVITLVAGILGDSKWEKPNYAKRCFIWGVAALAAYPFVFWFVGIRAVIGIAFLAVYGLYIAAAYRLKKIKAWHTIEISKIER